MAGLLKKIMKAKVDVHAGARRRQELEQSAKAEYQIAVKAAETPEDAQRALMEYKRKLTLALGAPRKRK